MCGCIHSQSFSSGAAASSLCLCLQVPDLVVIVSLWVRLQPQRLWPSSSLGCPFRRVCIRITSHSQPNSCCCCSIPVIEGCVCDGGQKVQECRASIRTATAHGQRNKKYGGDCFIRKTGENQRTFLTASVSRLTASPVVVHV